jgi:hypothetical protein
MNVEGLSGLVNPVIAWADRLQRRQGVLGFPYAVVKKYGDDEGGRKVGTGNATDRPSTAGPADNRPNRDPHPNGRWR